jgi:hypothetical protein
VTRKEIEKQIAALKKEALECDYTKGDSHKWRETIDNIWQDIERLFGVHAEQDDIGCNWILNSRTADSPPACRNSWTFTSRLQSASASCSTIYHNRKSTRGTIGEHSAKMRSRGQLSSSERAGHSFYRGGGSKGTWVRLRPRPTDAPSAA